MATSSVFSVPIQHAAASDATHGRLAQLRMVLAVLPESHEKLSAVAPAAQVSAAGMKHASVFHAPSALFSASFWPSKTLFAGGGACQDFEAATAAVKVQIRVSQLASVGSPACAQDGVPVHVASTFGDQLQPTTAQLSAESLKPAQAVVSSPVQVAAALATVAVNAQPGAHPAAFVLGHVCVPEQTPSGQEQPLTPFAPSQEALVKSTPHEVFAGDATAAVSVQPVVAPASRAQPLFAAGSATPCQTFPAAAHWNSLVLAASPAQVAAVKVQVGVPAHAVPSHAQPRAASHVGWVVLVLQAAGAPPAA